MKVAGIVCEYNPLHNGHLYHIEKTRQAGATHIVCAMSGNYVQRGEPAFIDKWARAETAVKCGADLVVEILIPWAVSGAESFARGGILPLNALGIDMLSFGCESDNEKLFLKVKEAVLSDEVSLKLKYNLKKGMSYPSALQSAVNECYGEKVGELLSYPNNILVIEYLKHLNKDIDLLPVLRKGVLHDDAFSIGGFMSASAIRNSKEINDCKKFVPDLSFELLKKYSSEDLLYNDPSKYEELALYALRTISLDEMKKYVSDQSGLCERIFEETKKACNLEELIKNVKVKNYTMARIRREILNIILKIPSKISKVDPPFIKVLSANKKGIEIISSSNCSVPVITKHSETEKLDDFSKIVYEIQCRASDVYGLLTKKNRACSMEQTSSMIYVK